jgi:hypothetical protein
VTTYDPFDWLPSAFEMLHEFIKSEVDAAVLSGSDPIGLQVYDIVMDYPDSADLPLFAEFEKTVIHFAIDDISNQRLGHGENKIDSIYDDTANTITEIEAQFHEVNFDVGVWASDQSGGTSSRLRAYRVLHQILGSEIARQKCREQTGIEIKSYTGGRYIIERTNDVRLYRIIGAELVIRLHGQQMDNPDVIADTATQVPELEIGSVPLSD